MRASKPSQTCEKACYKTCEFSLTCGISMPKRKECAMHKNGTEKDWVDKLESAWPIIVFVSGLIYRLIMSVDNLARPNEAGPSGYPTDRYAD